MNKNFKGVFSALVTPYRGNGEVDFGLVEKLVENQLAAGIMGFFVCGSTGEGILLGNEERRLVSEAVVRAVRGRVPVMVHVGHASTEESVRLARHSEKIGADAISSLPPLFFNFSPDAVLCHYSAIIGASGLPFFPYLYPSGGNGLALENISWLRKLNSPTLRGFKYTGSNIHAVMPILERAGGEFIVFSGSDELSFQALTLGVHGSIGTNQNVIPGAFVEIYKAFSEGDLDRAAKLQLEVNELTTKLLEIGLISSQKRLLELLGYAVGAPRLPIPPLSEEGRRELGVLAESSEALLKYGLGRDKRNNSGGA